MSGNPNHDNKGKFSSNATHGTGPAKDTSVNDAAKNNSALWTETKKKEFRLGQLLRDKASTKKSGYDVNSSDYSHYNHQIRTLRSEIKEAKNKK